MPTAPTQSTCRRTFAAALALAPFSAQGAQGGLKLRHGTLQADYDVAPADAALPYPQSPGALNPRRKRDEGRFPDEGAVPAVDDAKDTFESIA